MVCGAAAARTCTGFVEDECPSINIPDLVRGLLDQFVHWRILRRDQSPEPKRLLAHRQILRNSPTR